MVKLIATVESLAIRDKKTCAPRQGQALIHVELGGLVGDVHHGFTRPADSRDPGIVRGTPVRNWRQWSAVSAEEMAIVGSRMGIPPVDSCLLSANFTFKGIPNFTLLPRGTQILFAQGVVLTVEEENEPCTGPGKEIAQNFPDKKAHEFVKAAKNLRGIVGVVYRAGTVHAGEQATVVVYEPRTFVLVR